VVAIGSLPLNTFSLVVKTWLNWRPSEVIRGKWRQLVGKVGDCICGKLAPRL
jgi:hypothetical protein